MAIGTPEDALNQALTAIGYRRRIGSVYEGSAAARAGLEIYGQTRDEVLSAGDWSFAQAGGFALTLLKGPPPAGGYNPGQPWTTAYPRPPWLYEYAMPSDMLELRAVLPTPDALPVLLPRPARWAVENDNTLATPAKVILTNTPGALAVYVRRVTNPAQWNDSLFIATLIDMLAKKLAASPLLAASPEFLKTLPQEAAAAAALGDRHRG